MPDLEGELFALREQFRDLHRELIEKQRELDLAKEFFRRVADLIRVFEPKL